jgi:hypothetical protein
MDESKVSILIEHTTGEIEPDTGEQKTFLEIIEALGDEEINAIMVAAQIKSEIKFEDDPRIQNPHVLFQLIKGFIAALCTIDPTKVHYDIVRHTIKHTDEKLLRDASLIDMMARELIKFCKTLNAKLQAPKQLHDLLKNNRPLEEVFELNSGRVPPKLKVFNFDTFPELEKAFEQNSMFIWDKAFLKTLKSTGKEGEEFAEKLTDNRMEHFQLFHAKQRSPLSFWFNTSSSPENPFHLSPALQILTSHIFEDIVKKSIQFRNKYPPALVKGVRDSVNLIHKGRVEKTDDQIKMYNEGALIGNLSIAAIDQNLYANVFRGVDKFRTVTGHRLLRYLPQQAHNQKTNGIDLYNVLSFPGGYSQLADELNLRGERVKSDLKDLLHGLAYFKWNMPHFSGNFIVLGHYKTSTARNQHLGLQITLGPELCPYYACKQRELLIPILKDPQLVKPTQYYANQYLLQNEIMAEFSNQSIRLAEDGIIEISNSMWYQKGSSCGLPKRVIDSVKDCWIQDRDNGERFLEMIEKDIYTLGPAYHKELEFLKEQGELRKKRSQEALLSLETRKKH